MLHHWNTGSLLYSCSGRSHAMQREALRDSGPSGCKGDFWDTGDSQAFQCSIKITESTILYSLTQLKTHMLFNPLSLNGDQHQFSPNDIHTLSKQSLWELIKWSWKIFYQIFSANSLRKCIELSTENLYVDIGTFKRVKLLMERNTYLIVIRSKIFR